MQYIKNAVVVEASQWFKDGDHPAVKPMTKDAAVNIFGVLPQNWDVFGLITTLEGPHAVTPGDFIITGVRGENYPCKPDIFKMTYRPTPLAELKEEAKRAKAKGYLTEAQYEKIQSLNMSGKIADAVISIVLKALRFVGR